MSNDDQMPDDDARIRSLLAELGSGPTGAPLPPEVASRLDETLARLVAERDDAGPAAGTRSGLHQGATAGTNVVPLRRRWASRTSAAAAAVIVLGAGGVAAANFGYFGSGDSSTAAGSSGAADQDLPEASRTLPTPTAKSAEQPDAVGGAVALPELSSASFATEVDQLLSDGVLEAPENEPSAEASPGDEPSRPGTGGDQPRRSASSRLAGCPGPEITDGGVPTAVRYDGEPAVLVVHPERDGAQLVEAWTCDGDTRLARTTVVR